MTWKNIEDRRAYYKWYYYNKNGKERMKDWREKNPEKNRKIARNGYQKNKEKRLKEKKDYWKKNPNLRKVNNETNRKVKIPKNKMCEKCNQKQAKDKHHEDYSKPLEVRFLCPSCHRTLHIQNA